MTPERDALALAKRVISSHLDTLEAKQVAAALISVSEKLERAWKALDDAEHAKDCSYREWLCSLCGEIHVTKCNGGNTWRDEVSQ